MKQHGLALMTWLAVCALGGCGAGKSGPPPQAFGDPILEAPPSGDALQFSQGGMAGHTEVRWDPETSKLRYESVGRGRASSESWERQPSADEWARFWTAMDAVGVWKWKADYGQVTTYTDCVGWSLVLRHGSSSISSKGCGFGPEAGGFDRVIVELTRLRGDASAAGGLALDLASRLQRSTDWNDRMETVRRLGAMGPAAGAAVPALVELLDAAPPSRWLAAPGPEPVAVAQEVLPRVVEADRLLSSGMWDQAIALYDQVLARDPQSERAAQGRATAIRLRELRRQRAAQGDRDPSPAPQARPEDAARRQAELADAAEGALARIGEPAVAMLVQALQDGNAHRRRRAANALGGIGVSAESAVPALTAALQDPEVREAAARALVRIAPHSADKFVPVLGNGIDDRDADAARRSVAALGQVGSPDAAPALIQALDDERTRNTALFGLRSMGPRAAAAVPALIQVLQDPREANRGAAAQALGEIGMAAAAAIPALTDVVGKDPNGGVREAAARALGAMGPESSAAVPVLIDNLRHGDGGYRVAYGAAGALGRIGLPAVPALIAALKCDHLGPATPMSPTGYMGPVYPETENVRVYAAHALQFVGPRAVGAVPALRESLGDASPRVREAAAGALREIERH